MHNIGWTDAYDLIDDCVIDYFEARTKGGVGLIFTGAKQPDFQYDNGVIMKNPFQNPTTFVSRHKKLVDRVHTYGTKIFIQFGYGGGRVDFPAWIPGQGIAPSDCPNRWDPSIQHCAMTKTEIQSVIDASISAAVLCLQTGCDGIDINCYGGYTIDQFLQPCYNKRTDAYGGLDSGIKIMSEIVQGIKRVCGKNFPVTCRLGMRQHIKAVGQGGLDGEDYVEYGRTPEQSIYVAKKLAEAGYDAIYLGNGTYDFFYWLYPPMYQKEGLWLDDVEALTRQIDVPVICGGKILQPRMANDAIRDGKITAVVLGRQLLADPEWPNKARLGLDEEIRPCIGCNFGCVAAAIVQFFPSGLRGLVLVGVICAIISSTDILILVGAANLCNDIYQRHINPGAGGKKLLHMNTGASILVGLAAAVLGWRSNNIIDILLVSYTINAAGLFLPVVGAFFWRRSCAAAAFASMLSAAVVCVIWYVGGAVSDLPLFQVEALWPAFAVSAVLYVAICLTHRQTEAERRKCALFLMNEADPKETT